VKQTHEPDGGENRRGREKRRGRKRPESWESRSTDAMRSSREEGTANPKEGADGGDTDGGCGQAAL
jgi:hypothetical protein